MPPHKLKKFCTILLEIHKARDESDLSDRLLGGRRARAEARVRADFFIL